MGFVISTGTRDIPLRFAKELAEIVNAEWESGKMLEVVTPVTADLLKFWFTDIFVTERTKNFHAGQKQAILNAIYCHEVLGATSVAEMYAKLSKTAKQSAQNSTSYSVPEDYSEIIPLLNNVKHNHPKYCIKMATGTGKTWVLNALLVWQYLNAKFSTNTSAGKRNKSEQDKISLRWTKNFLLVAPGLIVYDRLLDAFKGKLKVGENGDPLRDFSTSDLKNSEELFIPEKYRDSVYSFVQNSVLEKAEIGKKVTADGMIAITNWHLLIDADEELPDDANNICTESFSFAQTQKLAKNLLPVTPGVSAGHALDSLDSKFLRGAVLEYLAELPDICVFNDEAHHIHESKIYGEVQEVEWQKSLNRIAKDKNTNFIQIDFSATPYNVTGSGEKRQKHYFAHTIVDFDLKRAMKSGLVKSFVIDKRKSIAMLEDDELNFKAERDGRKVVGLSNGQRLMLRAGLEKLKILEKRFAEANTPNKQPRMMVICEDTAVSPFVTEFFKGEKLSEEDIFQIDSGKKGEFSQKDWDNVKQKLFNMDSHSTPRIIVSVLMLREGFDVNNICVIVPLRTSTAPILLEQTLGRGLRLMWREPEYDTIKAENRRNLYELKKQPPSLYDILYVVEHPAFEKFYEDLDKDLIVTDERETVSSQDALGDIVEVGLKENYKNYDFFIPIIIREKEETLEDFGKIDPRKLEPFKHWSLEQLRNMVGSDNADRFVSIEPTIKVRFGEYKVDKRLFTAENYNEFLQRLVAVVSDNFTKLSEHGHKEKLPLIQVTQVVIMRIADVYIRTRLFDQDFDPLEGANWKILMVTRANVVEHIMQEICKVIYKMQTDTVVTDAVIERIYFSEVPNLKIRANYALNIVKSIYEQTQYPSNKGEFEKEFMLACDADTAVEKIIKINEHHHTFAKFRYLRADGMLASYFPDFLVRIGGAIYVVETKALKDIDDRNVRQKQRGALDFIKKINELAAEDRDNAEWKYVLLDDTSFYAMHKGNAGISDILERYALKVQNIMDRWFE